MQNGNKGLSKDEMRPSSLSFSIRQSDNLDEFEVLVFSRKNHYFAKFLEASILYYNSSLSDLYDHLTMPAELVKSHKSLDCVFEIAYGMIVGYLMEMHREITNYHYIGCFYQ